MAIVFARKDLSLKEIAQAAALVISVGDPAPNQGHGTSFERIRALTRGFSGELLLPGAAADVPEELIGPESWAADSGKRTSALCAALSAVRSAEVLRRSATRVTPVRVAEDGCVDGIGLALASVVLFINRGW